MNKFLGMTAVAALLAGCADKDEVPEDRVTGVVDVVTGTDSDGNDITTPVTFDEGEITVGSLEEATYDGTVVRVNIALDGPDALQDYALVSDGRTDGYKKFTLQASELNRAYTAIAGRTSEGELVAVVAMDGGQFNSFFGGGTVIQSAYSQPESGILSYAGNYAGLLNFGGEALPVSVSIPGAFSPAGASEITGKVFFNANFTDNKIEGGMGERFSTLLLDDGTTIDVQLADLVFVNSDVVFDGTFSGQTQLLDLTSVGAYSGAFGGTDAEYVGGVVDLGGDFMSGALGLDQVSVPEAIIVDNAITNQAEIDAAEAFNSSLTTLINGAEQEYGIFVIDACGDVGITC